jgi:hypothetical protein
LRLGGASAPFCARRSRRRRCARRQAQAVGRQRAALLSACSEHRRLPPYAVR